MGDWPAQSQDFHRVTISSMHAESVGVDRSAMSMGSASSLAWPVANQALYMPFVVQSPTLVARLFVLNGAAVSGNIDVGIYTTGRSLIVSAGSTAQAGTNALQFFDVADVTLPPGVYYFGLVLDNTTGTIQSINWLIWAVQSMGCLSQTSAFPLPNPATFAAALTGQIPTVGLTGRTV